MFVLDASVALVSLFGQAEAQMADAIVARIGPETAVVPPHFGLEVAALIAREVLHGDLAEPDAIALAREAAQWPVTVDSEAEGQALKRTLALAIAHRLDSYEAAYLEVCLRRAAPLATFNARLATIARVHGVGLLIGAKMAPPGASG